MKPHIIAVVSITSFLLAAAPALAQPRPGQLPPPSGQGGPPQRGQPAPPQQQQAAAPKPYKPVSISAPAAVTDPSFEEFRKQLGAIAEKKDRKALAGLMAPNFFWMGEKGDRADKKRSASTISPRRSNSTARRRPAGSFWSCVRGSDRDAIPEPQRHDLRAGGSDLQSSRA